MDILSLFGYMFLALVTLALCYIAARVARPALPHLMALGADSDSLQRRVFPVLGFVGALGIMIKLTVF